MTSSRTVRRVDGVTSQPSGERTVILNADGTAMTTVNGLGSFIWQLLDTPASTAEIEMEIQGKFEVATETARTDMVEFLEQLEGLGLIEFDVTDVANET